jgi:hypothetical protein
MSFSDVNEPHSNHHIRYQFHIVRVVAENQHDFDFYFTVQSLPFRARELYSEQQCQKICFDIARHTENIIRQSVQ